MRRYSQMYSSTKTTQSTSKRACWIQNSTAGITVSEAIPTNTARSSSCVAYAYAHHPARTIQRTRRLYTIM